jgi:hypothetical protein
LSEEIAKPLMSAGRLSYCAALCPELLRIRGFDAHPSAALCARFEVCNLPVDNLTQQVFSRTRKGWRLAFFRSAPHTFSIE